MEVEFAENFEESPFRLCHACEHRLRALALRPLEWFNLASLHGPWSFLLHDDFYGCREEDYGVAYQPEEEVEEPERFPVPTLDELWDNQERLIDYAMTIHFLDAPYGEKVVAALSSTVVTPDQKQALLSSLQRRLSQSIAASGCPNPSIEGSILQLCASCLGPFAAGWIRERWEPEYLWSESFGWLAAATAACLPFEEGWKRVTDQLALWPHEVQALACFRSPRTFDWMEENRIGTSTDAWGRIAALSHFTWNRARSWLEMGRPLSHVALAAIQACQYHDTMITKKVAPVLEEPATVEEMVTTLNNYYTRDPVANVRKRVASIVAALE